MDDKTPDSTPDGTLSEAVQNVRRYPRARQFKRGGVVMVLLVIGVSTFAAWHNEQSFNRLKNRGIHTTAVVKNCNGELGGSGSNGAGYICEGAYSINGQNYLSTINGLSRFEATSTKIAVVADPSNENSIEVASDFQKANFSWISQYNIAEALFVGAIVIFLLLPSSYLETRVKHRA
jgi:hypothetical protein